MSAFSLFSSNRPERKARSGPRKKNTYLLLEALEDRSLPSGVTISGFVYNDANNDGIFQSTETPIANNPVELHNAAGAVVASTKTDAHGFYQFNTDATVNQTQQSQTKTVTFAATPTDFNLQGVLAQFDPSLGTLQEVDITHAGSITSDIKAENTSTSSGTVINGTVSGNLTLTAPGVNDKLSISGYAGSFNAQAFGGQIDFQGASGSDFGQKTANGSNNIVLTGAALTPYIGTGTVQVTENAHATSTADGGGNVVVNVQSTGQANLTVVYKYIANNTLPPGNYTIVETQEPPGTLPGKNSSNGTVLNTPPGVEVIPVTVTNTDSPNNDFGKLKASSLAGTVYVDANDNGSLDAGEAGLPGVGLTLTGTDSAGNAVHLTTTTNPDGTYKFATVPQGNFTVTETPPAGYIDGSATAGSVGGTAGTEKVTAIALPAQTDAVNYNFGEIKGASLAGFVYVDVNSNGVKDAGDTGIANTALTLTGTDAHGNAVTAKTTTDASGAYQFTGLRAGNYTITETPPAGYQDATDNAGTLGGTVGHDVISMIQAGMGQAGENYNFGEKLPPAPPPPPGNPNPQSAPPLIVNVQGSLLDISKNQLMNDSGLAFIDPNVLGSMTQVDGIFQTLTNASADTATNVLSVQGLLNGSTTAAQVVSTAWNSDAHRVIQAQQLYQTYLGRNPTAGEQAAVAQALAAGATVASQAQVLLTSTAFQQQHTSTQDLATALYTSILGQTPSATTQQTLVQSMGNETLNNVVSSLMSSNTAVNRVVNQTFLDTLRRPASASEVANYTAQIQAGTLTTDQLAQNLLASQEFYQLAYNSVQK